MVCVARKECPLQIASAGSSSCTNNVAAGEYPCSNIDMLSFVSLSDLGSVGDSNDIWGWTDPMTKHEYAIVGLVDGTSFVDVTNPTAPEVVAFVPTQTFKSLWRDMKVFQNHVFIGAEAKNHGLQVFDLTRLRGLKATNPVTKLLPDAHYSGFGNSHNIVINEESGMLYAVGSNKCRGGLYILDVNSPKQPQFAGCFAEDGYTHDAQCLNWSHGDPNFIGKELCFAYNEDSLTIVDVTDKQNMKMISRTEYSLSAYTHQGWLISDNSHLLLNDELDEVERPELEGHTRTMLWNVEDLTAPKLVDSYLNAETSIDHNLYITKKQRKSDGKEVELAFLANYCSGLRIYDMSEVRERIHEIAYFDVAPNCDKAEFAGSWSVYPFFESGTIIVSSIERGLFVLRHDL